MSCVCGVDVSCTPHPRVIARVKNALVKGNEDEPDYMLYCTTVLDIYVHFYCISCGNKYALHIYFICSRSQKANGDFNAGMS